MYMHAYTLYSAVRPYGCSVILGSCGEDGPLMYTIDPSGVNYVRTEELNAQRRIIWKRIRLTPLEMLGTEPECIHNIQDVPLILIFDSVLN